jgi:O-antigen/teichoic acid export membrane protein
LKELSRVHRVSINAVTNFSRFFINMVISFLLIPFIIHSLGQEIYGLWTLSFSIIGFFSLLDFGFGLGVVKWTGEARVSRDFEHRNYMLSTVFFIYLGIAAAGMILLVGFSFFYSSLFAIPGHLKEAAVLVLIILGIRSLAIQIPMSLFKGILFGEQKIALTNIIQVFGTLVYAGSAWLFLSRGIGIVGLAVINCSAFLLENFLYFIMAFAKVSELTLSPGRVKKRYLKEAVSFSFYSFITAIAGLVLFNTDAMIIQLFLGISSVGLYGVALKIAEYTLVLSKQLVNVLTPLISELKVKKEDDSIRFLLLDLSRYLMTVGVMLAGTVYVFGNDLLRFWVGEDFTAAGLPLIILMTALMLAVPQLIASSVLTMTGHHKFTAKVSIGSIISNLLVSLLLVKPLGLVGIALGTLASSVLTTTVGTLWKTSRIYEFPFYRYFTRVYVPVLLPLPVLMGVGWGIAHFFPVVSLWDMIGKAIPGTLVYVVLFWVFFIDRKIKQQITGKFRRRK